MSSRKEFMERVEVRDSMRGCTYAFDLHERLTIVYGRNGCGKTRMLDRFSTGGRMYKMLEDVFEFNTDYLPLEFDYQSSLSEEANNALTSLLKSAGLDSLDESCHMSRGQERLLKLLQVVLNLQENLRSVGEKGLVLLDQPEGSLHIDTQRKLPSALLAIAPDVQFVIATHSPAITAKSRTVSKAFLDLADHTTFD